MERTAKAKDLYISPLFVGNLRYATSLKPDSIFILWLVNELYKQPLSESDYEVLKTKLHANGTERHGRPLVATGNRPITNKVGIMRSLILSALAVLLSACAADYRVSEVTDKYSNPAQPAIYAMDGNAIDYADLGFTRVSELNGLVARDRSTGKVLFAGFVLTRNTSDQEVAVGSASKWLNIHAGDEAVFLADGERIVLTATVGKTNFQVSPGVSYPVGTDHYDYAEYHATPEQFRKIAYAQHLEFKVSGQNGTVIYPRTHRALLDSFRRNLAQFYQDEIAGH